jgi:hypothetical protein
MSGNKKKLNFFWFSHFLFLLLGMMLSESHLISVTKNNITQNFHSSTFISWKLKDIFLQFCFQWQEALQKPFYFLLLDTTSCLKMVSLSTTDIALCISGLEKRGGGIKNNSNNNNNNNWRPIKWNNICVIRHLICGWPHVFTLWREWPHIYVSHKSAYSFMYIKSLISLAHGNTTNLTKILVCDLSIKSY